MEKEKAVFIQSLSNFFCNSEANKNDKIKELRYAKGNYSEFLYVIYSGHAQKRIFINGDNERGILLDFARFLNRRGDWEWLDSSELLEVEE